MKIVLIWTIIVLILVIVGFGIYNGKSNVALDPESDESGDQTPILRCLCPYSVGDILFPDAEFPAKVTKIIKNDCPETTALCPADAMCEIEAKDNQGLGGTYKIGYPCEMRLGYGGA
ncbi:MAG: hypothetical protein AABX10_03945 [Nanoarchaeota archaeon]